MEDPEFRADAQRGNMDVNPTSGADMEAFLKNLYATPQDVVQKASAAIQIGR
jgi:hypothetical protein